MYNDTYNDTYNKKAQKTNSMTHLKTMHIHNYTDARTYKHEHTYAPTHLSIFIKSGIFLPKFRDKQIKVYFKYDQKVMRLSFFALFCVCQSVCVSV